MTYLNESVLKECTVRIGSKLKFPNGEIKTVDKIMYINMMVDRYDFTDGSSCFCNEEWELIK